MENQTNETPVVNIAPAPTSEKLTQLNADADRIWAELGTHPRTSPEAAELRNQMIKNEGDIKAEIAAIKKTENDAKIAEKRAAELSVLNSYTDAVLSNAAVQADKKASIEDKNASSDSLAAIHETLVNKLLGKVSAPRTSAPSDKPAGTRGATGSAIKEMLLAKLAAGGVTVTQALKDTIAEGNFSRGTAGTARTELKEAGELIPYGENPTA